MNTVQEVLNSLNTREFVILVYIFGIFLLTLLKKELRQSYRGILQSFFKPIILIVVITQILYISLLTLILKQLGIWDVVLLKDTLIWIIASFVLVGTQINEIRGFSSIGRIIKQQFTIIILLEFIVQLFPFNIWIEVIIQPILFFLGIMIAVSGYRSDPKNKKANKFLSSLLGSIGIVFLIRALYLFFDDYQCFATLENIKLLLLPFIYTILFTPYLYFLSIYNLYDQLIGKYGRLRHVMKNRKSPHISYLQNKILFTCNLWLPFWSEFDKKYANEIILSVDDLDRVTIDKIVKKVKK